MELKLLFNMLRRWAWLLILGLLLGLLGGYLASRYQEPVYQATTRVMVIKPKESSVTAEVTLTDQELVQTYITLLTTRPVLEAASDVLGFPVRANQISARQTAGTSVLEVTAQAHDAGQAAQIANTLVNVLVEQNDKLQAGRFASSEEALQAQITQVENQIGDLQADIDRRTTAGTLSADERRAQERAELEEQIGELQRSVVRLEEDIDGLLHPALTTEEQESLAQNRLALAEKQFELSIEEQAYNSRVSATPDLRDEEAEASILALRREILELEQEIDDLTSSPQATDPAIRDQLVEKRSELAQQKLALDLALDRYSNLIDNIAPATDPSVAVSNQEQASLSLYEQLYANLLSAYESVRLARLQNTPSIVQVEEATVPNDPIQPKPVQNMALGAAVGLIIMGGIAVLIEYLDDTLKSPADITDRFGVPVIGFIAEAGMSSGEDEQGVIVAKHPRSPISEAFRALRTNLEFAGVDKPLHTILITSSQPSDGKSTIAVNLAASLAQGGNRVLLLDCDLRRPRIHTFFGVPNNPGLTDVLRGQLDIEDVVQPSRVVDTLSLVPSGSLPPNPGELLGSSRMNDILEQLDAQADIVIIDSPPFVVADSTVLAAKVDGVVLVIQPGQTNAEAARAMFEQLGRADARVVGVVMNRIPRKQGFYYGGYRYYYAPYYYSDRYYLDDESRNGHSSRTSQNRVQRALSRLRD